MSHIRLPSQCCCCRQCALSYDLRNSSYVFNARLKVCSDGSDVIAGGSVFQTLTAATGKARSTVADGLMQRPWNVQQRCRWRSPATQCRQSVVAAPWRGNVDQGFKLAIDRLQVRLWAVPLLCNGQVVHTCASESKQYDVGTNQRMLMLCDCESKRGSKDEVWLSLLFFYRVSHVSSVRDGHFCRTHC